MKAKRLEKEMVKFEAEIYKALNGITPEPKVTLINLGAKIVMSDNEIFFIDKISNGYKLRTPYWWQKQECFETVYECVNYFLVNMTNELTKELGYKTIAYKKQMEQYEKLLDDFRTLYRSIDIEKIIHNKDATIVWFEDKKKIVVKRAKGVKDDIYSAVAYALAKKQHETNTQFKRYVDSKVIKNIGGK